MTAGVPPGIPAEGAVIAGKYRVTRVLGKGGMGCVVAAHHTLLNQEVAVKFLLPGAAADEKDVARFLREAQAAATIRSEHVVRVLDVGATPDGAPFMVMEHLVGADLGTLVERQGPLPIQDAVAYVLQACEALAEAHAAGLVHRDIKPSNLFLTRRSDGSPLVKLLDFGIAKGPTAVSGKLTATGATLGSPCYMSPEQICDTKAVDARSDVWSLGATLHELLAGAPPFPGETVGALAVAIATQRPASLRKLRPDTPSGLEAAILGCLEKQPEARHPDVAALARALGPFAPPRAEISVERISRLLSGVPAPTGELRPRASAPPAAAPISGNGSSTGTTLVMGASAARPGRPRGLWIGLAAGLVTGALVVALAFGGRGPEIAADPEVTASSPAAPLPADTAETEAPPSAAPVIEPAPEPPPTSSASAAPSAPPSVDLPPPAPPPAVRTAPDRPRGTKRVDPFADQH